jgi:hypothetical protein
MAPLVLCPECQRHLRRSEATCPFCKADVRDAFSKMLPRAIPTERLGRTALMAFAAANLGVAACGGEVVTPMYGAPYPPDGAVSSGGVAGGSNTGGMRSGSGGRSMTGGAPGTGGYNTGGAVILPPYGIAPIPPEPPSPPKKP